MDDVLELIATTKHRDENGVWRETQSKRQVFCQIESVTRQEFFQAGRNGLNPEFTATIFAGDYDEERTCVWRGNPYAIYRTYHVPSTDYIELYVQREGGTNGEADTN